MNKHKYIATLVFFAATLLHSARTEASQLADKCNELGRNGDLYGAIALVNKYESAFPGDSRALWCRADAKYQTGDKAGALKDLQAAFSYEQSNLDILKALVQVYRDLGDIRLMCKHWTLFKYKNLTARYSERYDIYTPDARKFDAECAQ